jgi:prephenate dehydrogenase
VAHLLLIGTGLIGSSFALAARRAGVFDAVSGFDLDAAALDSALRIGSVTRTVPSIEAGTDGADAVLVAVPPGIVGVVARACTAIGARDVRCSTSAASRPLRSRRHATPRSVARRIRAVPSMAGAETRGADAVRPVPGPPRVHHADAGDQPDAIARVSAWWRACGAIVATTTAIGTMQPRPDQPSAAPARVRPWRAWVSPPSTRSIRRPDSATSAGSRLRSGALEPSW